MALPFNINIELYRDLHILSEIIQSNYLDIWILFCICINFIVTAISVRETHGRVPETVGLSGAGQLAMLCKDDPSRDGRAPATTDTADAPVFQMANRKEIR